MKLNQKSRGIIIGNGQKTRRALGIKAVLGRMTDLRKKNCSIHCATNNWMIVLGDGKARGQRMIIDKINELDQLLMPASQMTKNEAIKFMKKTKSDSEGWITLGKKLTFSKFIYNNPNGDGHYQTSTKSIYLRIIITKKTDPLFIQDAGFQYAFLSSFASSFSSLWSCHFEKVTSDSTTFIIIFDIFSNCL